MANRYNKSYPHISLDVFDYNRKKLCNLFDSSMDSAGQAYDIEQTSEQSGWKQIVFTLPFLIDKKRNFRWNYIKNEYLLRVTIGKNKDWFIIHSPKKTKSRRMISDTVTCSHISSVLKTKNLYMTFDDENGIGTLPYIMEQILKATGWKLGTCDTLYERDGETQKIRSLKSDGKDGAYQLITDTCNLFNAYPVFDGETKTVNVYALNHKGPQYEMTMGKDIESLSVEYSSDDIITRLYVEGEYGEDAYIGIDDVNPTGLSYLMNFDYYKSIGLFTDEHQKLLDRYYETMKKAIETIKSVIGEINTKENTLNTLWGQINYVFYVLSDGEIAKKIVGGNITGEQLDISEGNNITVIQDDNTYRVEVAKEGGVVDFKDTDLFAIKFVSKPSAEIGAKEVSIEAKLKLIENLKARIKEGMPEEKIADINQQIQKLETEIAELYNGTETTTGLYELMKLACNLVLDLNEMNRMREEALKAQEDIEVEFASAMGDMQKDGYWNNTNYAQGQEEFLYADALDMMEQMSKPSVKYSVSRVSQAGQLQHKGFNLELNAKVRIYDPDLKVNDYAYISKTVSHLDKPENDTVEISNEDITLSGLSLDSVLARITRLADLIEQKNSLYNRSQAIRQDGSIYMDRLNGQINILKNQLMSSTSNWYTDQNGNLIFESTSGKSAMMLCGEGFMIAYGRTENGDWNWRTFGTGEGFTADAIITGYLSADRIEARSITVDKLSSQVGAMIDLSENNSIKMIVEESIKNAIYKGPEPPESPEIDALWLDTSDPSQDVLKRWNGEEWIETTLSQQEIDGLYSTLSDYRTEITALSQEITLRVTQEQYRDGQANKADADWVTERLESIIQQTASDIMFQFNQAKEYTVEATEPFKQFVDEVRSYQRFSADGLELGVLDSPFIAKLSNTKLSFLQDGVEIAYISNNKMHITAARVTDRLSIGTKENGYFDWITTPTGQALKWRDKGTEE